MKNYYGTFLFIILTVIIIVSISCNSSNQNSIDLSLQSRDSATNQIITKNKIINPAETAIIIVDMWNDHHCLSAATRVVEMAPSMNKVLKAARQKGILIIHSPSDCMDFYKDTPQRQRAQDAPLAETEIEFKWNYFNPDKEGDLEKKLEEAGCSCDTPEPCRESFKAWESEITALEIGEDDAISDKGQEVYNLLQQRGINNVIIMGVHTNRCVLGRPFGIRQMAYLGKNVILCRDLTDSYHRDPGKHFEGLAKIIEHAEKYWCPTITSDQLTGSKPFRFKNDKTV